MKILYFISMGVLASVAGLCASDEVDVAWFINAVSVKTESAGYEFQIAVDDDRQLATLVVKWKDRIIRLDRKGLPRINKPILRRLRLSTKDGNAFGSKRDLCLSIPFNRVNLDQKGRLLATVDIVRFFFHEGTLIYWKVSEAVKGNPRNWKFTEYDAKSGKLLSTGFGKSDNNPFASFDFSQGDM